jgi:AcrR family transcriptional regulator
MAVFSDPGLSSLMRSGPWCEAGSEMHTDTGRPVDRPRARRLPRRVRERQILDAAVEIFAAHGFHKASMDEISGFAGISKPMIYTYLGSKEQLFRACVRREFDRLLQAIGSAVEDELPPDQQLWRGLCAFFAYVGEHPASWTVLHRQTIPRGETFARELEQWRARAVRVIAELLARATGKSEQPRTPERMEPFAAALVGASEALVDWWSQHPEHTAEGLAMRLMNLVWMGFGDLFAGRLWAVD